MQIRFLLGPAGSGKTYRSLAEIRNELQANPEGLPLIFLAPKQATFQLERQLLESSELRGFSRLRIVSFERLAQFVFEQARRPAPRFLLDDGRTMVFRALLNRFEEQLGIFRGAARRPGFADELARQVREFTHHGLTPSSLRELANRVPQKAGLPEKLQDFAFLFERYREWLGAFSLQDSDALLGAATDLLESELLPFFEIAGLWMDGFASVTPQERRFLVALQRYCGRSTLAFCVEAEKTARSPISPWFLVSRTISQCKAEIETRYTTTVTVETLARDAQKSRFGASPALRHLEAEWTRFETPLEKPPFEEAVRVFECADLEAEAFCCAREILSFVRGGGRFREAAVLLRDLNHADYPHILRRVLRRYEIPFFIDHRESVAHHPLAELTRGTLRTIAFDWDPRDWFSVLKSGLIRLPPNELDQIENEALARGWKGAVWREGFSIPDAKELEKDLNRRREQLMPPFLEFAKAIEGRPSGRGLAQAVREFWRALSVQEQLESWSGETAGDALHATVWDQMNSWLDNLELAFADQQLYLRQWIPVLEAGLSSLSVGVIPPVLDEVSIGAVDRSRNPDLKLLCILGFNERVFPAVPGRERLLTDEDRSLLLAAGSDLAHIPALKLAAEQFFGYIACTRARERLRVTYSRAALDGAALNPSRFLLQLKRVFPELDVISWKYPDKIEEIIHRSELPLVGIDSRVAGLKDEKFTLSSPASDEGLDIDIAGRLYGPSLKLSVSALERFAACPFRFFAERGLNVRERKEFLLDVREQGSFQHAVLAQFHEEVTRDGKKWRELSPAQAREKIGTIAEQEIAKFREGLLLANKQNQFTAQSYKAALQDFIEVIAGWFETNRFEPEQVEFAFGSDSGLPGWEISLPDGRSIVVHGRVDRIDVHPTTDGEALCLIVDYKSGLQAPDRTLMFHGVQQQLPAYLLAITQIPQITAKFGVRKLRPAGCFILPLSANFETGKTRQEALADVDYAHKAAYMHNGLFDVQYLSLLDANASTQESGQFKYCVTDKGEPYENSFNALTTPQFQAVLSRSESLFREFGERIFAGNIAVRPYKKGRFTACDKCRMRPICRFDSWTQPFNHLAPPPKNGDAKEQGKSAR